MKDILNWPDIGFWPTAIIVVFALVFAAAVILEAILRHRIARIMKRQSANPETRGQMNFSITVSPHAEQYDVVAHASKLAEPERTTLLHWAKGLRLLLRASLACVAVVFACLVMLTIVRDATG